MRETVKKYSGHIILLSLFVFFVHSSKLNSGIVGIDTEDMINLQGGFYRGWLETGRQGLVGLKWLFGTRVFNPYFAGLMTLIFLAASLCIFLLVWEQVWGEEPLSIMAFFLTAAVWSSHPVMTEQLYFSLQSMEICAGIALTAVSLFLVRRWEQKKSPVLFAGAVLSALLVFSVYQAFVPLYIFGTVSILVLQGFRMLEQEEGDGKMLLKKMLPYLCAFLAAFTLNMVITHLFFSSSDYLDQQIAWGRTSVPEVGKNIIKHILQLYTGYASVHYSGFYGILLLLLLFNTVLFVKRRKTVKKGVLFVQCFYLFSLWATPFLMTLVCGCAPAVRAQMVLPASSAYLVYLCVRLGKESRRKRGMSLLTLFICVVGILGQMQTTLRLYYTEQCRYEQDVAWAREMIQQIDKAQGKYPVPVAFIGRMQFQGNSSTLAGETMGRSFFEHDAQVEPAYYYSTGRILGLMRVLGSNYKQVSPDRMDEAWEHSCYMPEWPAENSVKRWDDMIVIKLTWE